MNYFKELVAKANASTNTEEVKKIRNKILKISGIITVICGIGTFLSFVMFAIGGFINVSSMDFNIARILIPFFLFPIFGFGLSIGVLGLKAGLAIVVAQEGSKFLDTNTYCPYCHDIVSEDEKFCNKCGKPLLKDKICKKCNTKNDLNDLYCKECGEKL